MSLSDEEVLEEMESWRRFGDTLRAGDKELFREMMRSSYEYTPAMHAKASPFATEALFMSILLRQHKVIAEMTREIEALRRAVEDAGADS